MNFLAIILFPFTLLYDLATRFRNYLFDIGYKKSFEFDVRVISVGNLSVGGTGKTPMVEYLIRLLKGQYTMSTLSRGYGRKTKGFRLADEKDTYQTIGDEPRQFQIKFPDVQVSVGEERAVAIPFILAERPDTNLILLDDAYQHRTVKPLVNILLTDYNRPFFEDYLLPSGRLREARKGARRADVVIVTKCPAIDEEERKVIQEKIAKYSDAPVYFSAIRYLEPKEIFSSDQISNDVFIFSGLANHSQFSRYVEGKFNLLGEMHFKDHHAYSQKDFQVILAKLASFKGRKVSLLTTEKDMVKLIDEPLKSMLNAVSVFYLPIETYFLENGRQFDELILNKLDENLTSNH